MHHGLPRATNKAVSKVVKGRYLQTGFSQPAVAPPASAEDLIERARATIEKAQSDRHVAFRAAAEDLALASERGATQRTIASGVGKSVAWVNRLLQWRRGGCVGAPFRDAVHGLNKNAQPADVKPKPDLLQNPFETIGEGSELANDLPIDCDEISRMAIRRLQDNWLKNPLRELLAESPPTARTYFLHRFVVPALEVQ